MLFYNVKVPKISIVYKTKIKKKLFNLVIEINSFVYEKLQTNRKISIGWSCCPFFDDLGIVRCYSCWSYGHFARTCNKIACPTCSENHSKCNNENKKSINCLNANSRYRLNLDIKHEAWDKNCPSFLRIVEKRKKFLNFK